MAKKLSKNSPIEARFHREMREMHKSRMRDLKSDLQDFYLPNDRKSSVEYALRELHRISAENHDAQYKAALG